MIQARSNNNQKVRMPVTEQNSTIKIAPFNEKILQKIQFPICPKNLNT